jgi:Tol biopolymer transport system component
LLFYLAGHLTMIDPDGMNEKKVSEDRGKFHPGDAKLSPDGKNLAVLIQNDADNQNRTRNLYVRELAEKEPGTDLGFACQMFSWSPDGTKIATSDFEDAPPDKSLVAVHYLVDLKTKEKTAIKLPDNHIITDWSRDGKYFLTTATTVNDGKPSLRLHLMNQDGTEHKVLTDAKEFSAQGLLSPDGARVLFLSIQLPKEKQDQPRRELNVLEIATGKKTLVADQPLNGDIQGFCWSPDGKRIVFTWREIHEGKPEDIINKETESSVVVCDPDGKNPKTIASEKGQGQWIITIGHIDWR